MIHARTDYDRMQDPALKDLSLLATGSSPIAEDEPVFLVRASDQAFVTTLEAWAAAHIEAGGDSALAGAVRVHIVKAKVWQKANRCKIADAPDEVL